MDKKRPSENVTQVYIPDRKSWRTWLSKNHDKEKSIWLVYDKVAQGGKLTYDDIVEECLCWGWIDSLVRLKDEKQSMRYISVRKKGSIWSAVNKARLPKLIDSGQMTEHGLKVIERAKADGSWSSLDAVENLEIPKDLLANFAKNKKARANFEKFSKSNKKQILYYIISAKQEETRQRRIEQIITAAETGRNPLEYRAKNK